MDGSALAGDQEALIGNLFILAATGSVPLLAGHPHGGDYLKDLLVGQILDHLAMLIPIAICTRSLLTWHFGRARLGRAVLRHLRVRHYRLGANRRRLPCSPA
jgi:hypothetical protein